MNGDNHYIKIVEGIPFFSEDRYWGKNSKVELEKALSLIKERGWDEFKVKYQHRFDFTFEENRADWRFMIPLSRDSRVLDAGAGMGRISVPLARVVGKVVALDPSFLRMKFLKLRAEKEGLKNIEVYVGDIFDKPFSRESFDLIVMNGLLEWVGVTDRFSNPREAQIASLKICRDLLKKDGYLYVGIENRFALSYLRGRDHSGLYYTSYLPRWLANFYTKFRKGENYQTYTYTKVGYEKLFREVGFDNVSFYLPYPGYNLPRVMIPYNNLKALAYLIGTTRVKSKIVRYLVCFPLVLRLYRYFFFSFGIVIKK
ncbi:MAG TPA: class I SAM-dependent methyltransferase [Candidatus Paceibacterota bacterium]|nr:class I SAM-dependent methyltransferase [Candidatus Paceibacterota bacterium]